MVELSLVIVGTARAAMANARTAGLEYRPVSVSRLARYGTASATPLERSTARNRSHPHRLTALLVNLAYTGSAARRPDRMIEHPTSKTTGEEPGVKTRQRFDRCRAQRRHAGHRRSLPFVIPESVRRSMRPCLPPFF